MRCFAAIDLSDEIRQKISALQEKMPKQRIKSVERGNLHITLKFYGEVDDIGSIEKKISEICKKAKSFEINIKDVGCFPDLSNIRVIWIGIESDELINLQKLFESEKPHLTIARVKTKTSHELKTFMEKNRDVEIGRMSVNKIKLKKSILTEKGPVYEDIKVFELG